VNFPEPREGLVIRYSYLWNREHRDGCEDAIKDRPCAIVLTVVDAGEAVLPLADLLKRTTHTLRELGLAQSERPAARAADLMSVIP